MNKRRGFNRLFLVLTLLWTIFWNVAYPLEWQWKGQLEVTRQYDEWVKNCDPRDVTVDCYKVAMDSRRSGLEVYSFTHFWWLPLVAWRVFLPLTVVPPLVLYGLALLCAWTWRGFKPRPPSNEAPGHPGGAPPQSGC